MSEKHFPIIVPDEEMWPKLWEPCVGEIPFNVIESFQNQVWNNHGQTLKHLAKRGGLSPTALVAVIHHKSFVEAWPRFKSGFWREYEDKNKAPHPDHYRAVLFVNALAGNDADPHRICDKHYCEIQRERIKSAQPSMA